MFYHMQVAGLERDLPICPLNDSLSIAGFVIRYFHQSLLGYPRFDML